MTEISDGVFSSSGIEEIDIPIGVKRIGFQAFIECLELEKVTIPETVTVIDEHAFARCSSLKEIELPSGLEQLGPHAFSYAALESIVIPQKVTELNDTFFNCEQLKSVTIPKSVKTIYYGTFYNCPRLENINYEGTMAEWRQIFFAKSMEPGFVENVHIKTVTCSDGVITIDYSKLDQY